LDETFTATRGGGAFLNGAPIRVSPTSSLSDAILATGFPYRRNELEHNNLANFNRFFLDVRGIRRFGSAAMDLAYVAAGRFDGYWELHLSPHDVAAGALLVREAGGIVSDADGGDDWLRAGHLVAANPTLQPLIRERIVH
jgi:myo-inositol-1(or 4)-monophosphatase